ncbi:MAG: hypothetical protein IJS10_03925 [Alphaproteobacteria bacterium]|nr:hypothetical protein [Alphaproteobacteria bacterium]
MKPQTTDTWRTTPPRKEPQSIKATQNNRKTIRNEKKNDKTKKDQTTQKFSAHKKSKNDYTESTANSWTKKEYQTKTP